MINEIKTAVRTKLITLNVGEVNFYEKVGFDAFPAVNLTMAGNDSEFWSVSSNQRAYNLKIRVFLAYNSNKEKIESTLGDVVDSILEELDKDITLGGKALFVRAAPSSWGYVEAEEGWFRSADINLQVIKNINTRS